MTREAFNAAVSSEVTRTCSKAYSRAKRFEAAVKGESECVSKLDQAIGQLAMMGELDAERIEWALKYQQARTESEAKWSTVSVLGVSALGISAGTVIGFLLAILL